MPLPGVLDGKQPAPGKGGFTPAEEHAILAKYYLRADRFTKIALGVHFVLALAIAECYDTWLVTIPVAVAAVALFLCSSALLPGAFLTRCTAGVSLAIFVTLHIYQMHGLPEMHFLFFTTLTIRIAYCDWKAMWPATLYIVVQHVTFAWLTNQGSEVFFFPESYVDATKLSFHFGFAGAQAIICGGRA